MEPFPVVHVDVVVEDGVPVRKLWHPQLRVLDQVDFQLLAIRILQECSQRPHHAENEDLEILIDTLSHCLTLTLVSLQPILSRCEVYNL